MRDAQTARQILLLTILGVVVLGGLNMVRLRAQSAAADGKVPAFEVASVKRNVSGDPRSGSRNSPGGRLTISNQPLRQIIRSAYGSNDLEILGGPDWIDADRWDIAASAATGEPDAPWRLMLQSLLVERFRLRAHTEEREQPIYALIFARGDKRLGPSLHPSSKDLDCRVSTECGSTQANTNGVVSGEIIGTARTLTDIGHSLSRYAERLVFDRTRLDGRYDFDLRWSEDVSIFTSIEEQLGLKLESTKGPVDVIVIDHVERPTED